MLDHTILECGFGGGNMYGDGTRENCSFVGNQFQPRQKRNNPYSNIDNQGWSMKQHSKHSKLKIKIKKKITIANNMRL